MAPPGASFITYAAEVPEPLTRFTTPLLGSKSTVPVNVPVKYELPALSTLTSATVSVFAPPNDLAHWSPPAGPSFHANPSTELEVLVRLTSTLGSGLKSRTPANVPAAYAFPIESMPSPVIRFGAPGTAVTTRGDCAQTWPPENPSLLTNGTQLGPATTSAFVAAAGSRSAVPVVRPAV